jgi:hypothetical protein
MPAVQFINNPSATIDTVIGRYICARFARRVSIVTKQHALLLHGLADDARAALHSLRSLNTALDTKSLPVRDRSGLTQRANAGCSRGVPNGEAALGLQTMRRPLNSVTLKRPSTHLSNPDAADNLAATLLALSCCKPGADKARQHLAIEAVNEQGRFGSTERSAS